MDNFNDAFEAPEQIEEVKPLIDRTISQAKKCVSLPDFEEYRKQLEKARDGMVNSMIIYTHSYMLQDSGDMAFYGAKMMRMVTKLQDLNALLSAVEGDLRKEKL